MKTLSLLLVAALLGLANPASAQWMWIDKDGRKVFSDRAPPNDVPAKNVLRQPGMPPRSAPDDTPAAKPSQAGVSAEAGATPKAAGKGPLDKVVEERKRQAEAAAQQKQQAEDAKTASNKAENCARARQNLATLQSGIRISQVSESGERSYMDDNARSAELTRTQGIIGTDCQ